MSSKRRENPGSTPIRTLYLALAVGMSAIVVAVAAWVCITGPWFRRIELDREPISIRLELESCPVRAADGTPHKGINLDDRVVVPLMALIRSGRAVWMEPDASVIGVLQLNHADLGRDFVYLVPGTGPGTVGLSRNDHTFLVDREAFLSLLREGGVDPASLPTSAGAPCPE